VADSSLDSARTHARLRMLGVPLFWVGACGLLATLGLWIAGMVPGACVMLYVASTGLSLATFGTHNDSALAWMMRAGEDALDPDLRSELRQELAADRQGVSALTPTPRIAWAMTFIALGLHAWAAFRLLGALA
jgi:hypothetical protein